MFPRRSLVNVLASFLLLCSSIVSFPWRTSSAQHGLPSPEQFLGFRVGEARKLARWDKIVEYMQLVAKASDRVRLRELGSTTNGNPFIALEISSPETMRNLGHYKELEKKLYFQGGAPTDAERDDIFRSGKAVVAVTCNIHSTEIGASQMALELVHRLATEDSPEVRKILENVILVLVPSLNPDGQIMVTDWYNKNVGTEYEASPLPWLYHPYVGHDNNRDMYMFTQKESRLTAKLLWRDWFPSVWLDEHQQGSQGARIFVMPATDPINPNVHPLIYRWNGILGQSQAAALEAAGKEGIIYNSTYTNFWEGAMAWSGWWHNQIGLLTEVASARIASPLVQRKAELGRPPQPDNEDFQSQQRRQLENPNEPLPPPRDVTPRTEYPRPWLGGTWTLRDIVDYELIVTMALLETAADKRETLLRQIYEVNRETVESGSKGNPSAILINPKAQHDPDQAAHLVERLQMGGVEVSRAEAEFEAGERKYPAGTFVIPMTQVFARYAKDMLEKQTYPEVRRTPASPPEPPYDVTAWSLGKLMDVDVEFISKPLSAASPFKPFDGSSRPPADITGSGKAFEFELRGVDSFAAVNSLLRGKSRVLVPPAALATGNARARSVLVLDTPRTRMESVAREFGLSVRATEQTALMGSDGPALRVLDPKKDAAPAVRKYAELRSPRIGLYQSWTANMDEGWTRWVLEQYGFAYTTLHNADIKAGKLHDRYDAIILPDQQPRDILEGLNFKSIRPEYRGGIGDDGVEALRAFVKNGGSLITLGASCDLVIDKFPIPVKDLKRGLTRDQHFAPGTIVRIQVDANHPVGVGMPAETYGFYNNSPFFALTEGFSSQRVSVVARYPNAGVVASGWLRGEELMAGRAAVVSVEMNPGRIVLFGLRPQHRAQTHATFPLLFNALSWSSSQ